MGRPKIDLLNEQHLSEPIKAYKGFLQPLCNENPVCPNFHPPASFPLIAPFLPTTVHHLFSHHPFFNVALFLILAFLTFLYLFFTLCALLFIGFFASIFYVTPFLILRSTSITHF